MGTLNNFLEHVSTFTFNSLNWFCKLAPSVHICYFCERVVFRVQHSTLASTCARREVDLARFNQSAGRAEPRTLDKLTWDHLDCSLKKRVL